MGRRIIFKIQGFLNFEVGNEVAMARSAPVIVQFFKNNPEIEEVVVFMERALGLSTGGNRIVISNIALLHTETGFILNRITSWLYKGWATTRPSQEDIKIFVQLLLDKGDLKQFTENEILALRWSALLDSPRHSQKADSVSREKKKATEFDDEVALLLLNCKSSPRSPKRLIPQNPVVPFVITETRYPHGTLVEFTATGKEVVVRVKVPK